MRDTTDKVVAVKGSTTMASELRALATVTPIVSMREDGAPQISAEAIRFNSWSVDLGGFRERMLPGSVILDRDLVILFDHDTAKVVGRPSAGTATVAQDERAVTFTATPPSTTWASDLLESMKRGDIRGCSFRMMVDEDKWYVDNGQVCRDVIKARVSELTITSMPAYPETTAEARSRAAELIKEKTEDRAGRVLSADNQGRLTLARDVLDMATELIEKATETIDAVITTVDPTYIPDSEDGMEACDCGGSGCPGCECSADSMDPNCACPDAECATCHPKNPENMDGSSTASRSSVGATEKSKKPETFVPGFGFIHMKGK